MSTGVNLGHDAPLNLVDIHHDAWFAELLGLPGLADSTDQSKLAEARALVLEGVKTAISEGADASALGVVVPPVAPELAAAAHDLGVAVVAAAGADEAVETDETFVLSRLEATVGDHAANAVSAAALARQSDALHTRGIKLICDLVLVGTNNKPASASDVARTIAGLQAGGVEADMWLLAPQKDLRAIAEQACTGGRGNVGILLRGAPPAGESPAVLGLVAAEDVYGGALRAWVSGDADAGVSADQIGAAIAALVDG